MRTRKSLAAGLMAAVMVLLVSSVFAQGQGQELLKQILVSGKVPPFLAPLPVGQAIGFFPDLREMTLGDFFRFLEEAAGVPTGTFRQTKFGELKVGAMAVEEIKQLPSELKLPDVLRKIAAEKMTVEEFVGQLLAVIKKMRPWDVNGDGVVNIFDLVLVGARFGQQGPEGDVNGDGTVNIFDLVLIASHFGERIGMVPPAAPQQNLHEATRVLRAHGKHQLANALECQLRTTWGAVKVR